MFDPLLDPKPGIHCYVCTKRTDDHILGRKALAQRGSRDVDIGTEVEDLDIEWEKRKMMRSNLYNKVGIVAVPTHDRRETPLTPPQRNHASVSGLQPQSRVPYLWCAPFLYTCRLETCKVLIALAALHC